MSGTRIVRSVDVERTPRVLQLEGIFDVPPSQRSQEEWFVDLELPAVWNVGLIVGPSGSGKTTVARELFGDYMRHSWDWHESQSIMDDFPKSMSIREITELLSSVGFSSPPSWVRPFRVLSNGEQFRVNLARTLAELPDMAVVDEFTSVVDRMVAQIGSAAVAKTVRKRNQKFVAVACHYDIIEWLEPDWIFQPHTNTVELPRGNLHRPSIKLEVRRVHSSAWQLFRKHHYLDTNLNTSAICFCAFWNDKPVAFTAVLHFPHAKVKNIKREHRTVCLPDYQGVGIGNALSDYVGSICRGLGFRFMSQTSHPGMIRSRNKSANWKMKQEPTHKKSHAGKNSKYANWFGKTRKRLVASFEYTGPALNEYEARLVWSADMTSREPVRIA